jgi:hypothetical protein
MASSSRSEMVAIRIELPDVASASDLKSHLDKEDADSLVFSIENVHGVLVEATSRFPTVLASVHDWVAIRQIGTVPVVVGGTRHTISG